MQFIKIHSHRGSALLIGMWLIIVLTIIGIVFLEKIWRFSERTENIEQSNVAYYLATAAIERAIYTTDKRTPWAIDPVGTGEIISFGYTGTASPYTTVIPKAGNGNSEFDSDWNILALGEPVQIVIPNKVAWGNVYFRFRVSDLDRSGLLDSENLDATQNGAGIVNWVFASSSEALFASGEVNVFIGDEIQDGLTSASNININNKFGNTSSGQYMNFDTFYNDTSHLNGQNDIGRCASYGCTLKLSLLRPLLVGGQSIPFLEYQIDFQGAGVGDGIPDQYINLTTKGYSYGFLRSRTVQIPQITTNTALDFTILQ